MYATQSAALYPMTGITLLFFSIVLLVNKFHYFSAGSKNKTYILKPYFMHKINVSVMKTLVLYVKEKWNRHKNIS